MFVRCVREVLDGQPGRDVYCARRHQLLPAGALGTCPSNTTQREGTTRHGQRLPPVSQGVAVQARVHGPHILTSKPRWRCFADSCILDRAERQRTCYKQGHGGSHPHIVRSEPPKHFPISGRTDLTTYSHATQRCFDIRGCGWWCVSTARYQLHVSSRRPAPRTR